MGSRARVIQVIETDEILGRGTPEFPFRRVTQYWSVDGRLLAVVDPYDEPPTPRRAVHNEGESA